MRDSDKVKLAFVCLRDFPLCSVLKNVGYILLEGTSLPMIATLLVFCCYF